MYMSQLALDYEKEDRRYEYCLRELYKKLGKELKLVKIERPGLEDVQEFDYFYGDFKSEINKIEAELDEGDELLLNTSSGTPAMKSAIVVLATLGDVNGQLIQVTTPEKTINTHVHENYDVKTLWELDPDNKPDHVNRCKPITCPSIVRYKNEEMIKKLISSYDYNAALDIVRMMNTEYTQNYIHLVEYACLRSQLDFDALTKLVNQYEIKLQLPVMTSVYRNTVEYALSLFVKAERGEYAEFVRGLTPLILELYVQLLKKETKINARDYCFIDKYSGGYKWNARKVENDNKTKAWLNIWNEYYSREFQYGYLQAIHLLLIIRERCGKDMVDKAELLRAVEENVRNSAAHEIGTVTAETVVKMTGYSCDKIISTIKDLFSYSGVVNNPDVWDSYCKMNQYIIDQIGSADV